MKVSPVQLRVLSFDRVCVELNKSYTKDESSTPLSLSGVLLRTAVEFTPLDGSSTESPYAPFQVSIDLEIDSSQSSKNTGGLKAPYLVKMTATGLIEVARAASRLAPIEELAAVNGATLVWASMREQLATVTGRMPLGSVQLPSVSFQDLRAELQSLSNQSVEKSDTTSSPESKPSRKRTSKKTQT